MGIAKTSAAVVFVIRDVLAPVGFRPLVVGDCFGDG
jgi:hypothetical protein